MTDAKVGGEILNAKEILQRIADTWMIRPGRSHWDVGGPAGYQAFSWWPGDFCLTARANQHVPYADADVRVRIDTDFLRGLDVHSIPATSILASLAHFFSSTYALVLLPVDILEDYGEKFSEDFDSSRLWLTTTAYVRAETAGWLPEFIARMAILQPINAQIHATDLAQLLGAELDVSLDPYESQSTVDGILGVLDDIIVPSGRLPSKWESCEEFVSFAETWARSDNCFGTGDPTGLTLETPFGDNSALIRLLTDQPHPQLGNGLFATLQLPMFDEEEVIGKLACELNYMEAIMWTGFPLIGCWHSRVNGDCAAAAFSMFIPNAFHAPMIATHVAFWMLNRAQWVKNIRFEGLVNRAMSEILERRLREANE